MSDTGNGSTSPFRRQLAADVQTAGGPVERRPDDIGIGKTLFDLPGSTDLTITVVIPKDKLHEMPSQSLVRIDSRVDGKKYLGVVTAGPFAEPDGLRGDSPMLTAVATHGGDYLPPYHGRVQVAILGEELAEGALAPPRLRPLPNSAVAVLTDAESEAVLKCAGDIRLGLAVGHERVVVGVPSELKSVLPRHTAILGTTGGGKSTTVAGLVKQAAAAGVAVVLLDVEGEYTHMHEPTDRREMLDGLKDRGLAAGGVPADRMAVYHLVGRDTANPGHPNRRPFSIQFARLSPYAAMEILDLSEAQRERFLKAYDIAREVLRDLDVFPKKGNAEQERLALELDELERGYPRMTISLLMDVVRACAARAEPKGEKKRGRAAEEEDAPPEFEPNSRELKTPGGPDAMRKRMHAANPPASAISWYALLGRLSRLNRLRVFYDEQPGGTRPLDYAALLKPGAVSVVDLSDTGYGELNNLVIADLLRGIQEAQERVYARYEAGGPPPTPALIVVEEAHEFLSAERIERMRVLFEQVARVAKRGRKRKLGLAFVTQLPAHLPKEVLGLCNNFLLHKLTDPGVVGLLRRTVGGVNDGLWDRVPNLAPGQAVASFGHFAQPLLVSIDPAPCRLRLAD